VINMVFSNDDDTMYENDEETTDIGGSTEEIATDETGQKGGRAGRTSYEQGGKSVNEEKSMFEDDEGLLNDDMDEDEEIL